MQKIVKRLVSGFLLCEEEKETKEGVTFAKFTLSLKKKKENLTYGSESKSNNGTIGYII